MRGDDLRFLIIILAAGFLVWSVVNYFGGGFSSGAGESAPNFTLKTYSGETVSLSDYKKRPVFLYFWASWCPYCRRGLPTVKQFTKRARRTALSVLAVDIEGDRGSEAEAKAMLREVRPNFTVLVDSGSKVGAAYKNRGLPGILSCLV